MLTRNRPEPAGDFTRAVPLATATWNAEALTFDVVLSTGAPVVRQDQRGLYDEILDVRGAVIPDRLPLLDSHNRFELDGRLGEVTNIRLSGGQLVGTARLSRHSPLAQRIAAEIGDGARFGVSIGYDVPAGKWTERVNPTTQRREKVATAFILLEASLVAIPADPAATTRTSPMETEDITNPPAPTPAATPAPLTRAQTNAEIRTIARTAGMDDAWANTQIDAEATLDAVRAAALTAMAERSRASNGLRGSGITVGADHTDPASMLSAMGDALAHRLSPARCRIEGRAVQFGGYRILDMIGDLAVARGERIDLRNQAVLMERAVGAHSTSDFPGLLADAANKSLLANYQAAAPTYRQWAARRQFNDFKDHNFLRIGDFPKFKEIGQNGEVKYGTISENREKVAAKELTAGIIIGRRALLNDDLSALADFSSMIAVRSASDENERVYALLAANPVLSDGLALFHANHGNLSVYADHSDDPIRHAVAALRKQKSLDGLILNLAPAFLIVGPDQETFARRQLTAVQATKAEDVNLWAGMMSIVVDANIAGDSMYIAVAPETAPTIVYGYVSGAEGPQIRTAIDFDTRAVKVAAGLDFGCGVIDFRGLHKYPGA